MFSLGGQQPDSSGHTRPHSLVLVGLCRQVFKNLSFIYFCGFVCIYSTYLVVNPEAEFLGEIQTKVLRVFLLVIRSHLYSFA